MCFVWHKEKKHHLNTVRAHREIRIDRSICCKNFVHRNGNMNAHVQVARGSVASPSSGPENASVKRSSMRSQSSVTSSSDDGDWELVAKNHAAVCFLGPCVYMCLVCERMLWVGMWLWLLSGPRPHQPLCLSVPNAYYVYICIFICKHVCK
jgi:hypothetical protein